MIHIMISWLGVDNDLIANQLSPYLVHLVLSVAIILV